MSKPSQADIAKHAYHLWEREGRPHGRDKDHWHTAEREILGAATAQEDRPIGEIRAAQRASAQQMSAQQANDRQTGSATPSKPAHPASPDSAATKQAPQTQGKQSVKSAQVQAGQPIGTPGQQSSSGKGAPGAAKSEPSSTRKPRARSRQTDT